MPAQTRYWLVGEFGSVDKLDFNWIGAYDRSMRAGSDVDVMILRASAWRGKSRNGCDIEEPGSRKQPLALIELTASSYFRQDIVNEPVLANTLLKSNELMVLRAEANLPVRELSSGFELQENDLSIAQASCCIKARASLLRLRKAEPERLR